MIENTNSCNANCIFCPHKIMKRKRGVMSMDLYKRIINDCVEEKIDFVTVYGFGEPLLDRDFIKRLKYAKTKGIKRLTTNTNAMYLTENIARQIIEAGLDEIFISFDAETAKTYRQVRPGLDFATVEKNIKTLSKLRQKLKRRKPEIVLSFVETDINRAESAGYIKKWQKTVDHISVSQIHNWTGDIDNGRKIIGQRDPCRLLWTDMVVSWDGKVPLCCNDYENKVILGDMKKQSISEVWGGKKLARARKMHVNGNYKAISLCKNCQYNYHHKSPWWVGK